MSQKCKYKLTDGVCPDLAFTAHTLSNRHFPGARAVVSWVRLAARPLFLQRSLCSWRLARMTQPVARCARSTTCVAPASARTRTASLRPIRPKTPHSMPKRHVTTTACRPRPTTTSWLLPQAEVAVRRAVHRQEKVREERLRRDQRVVPTHTLGSERRLELALDAVVVVARRRALRVAVRAAVVARVEEHVPQAAQRRERIIRPAVPFMVPVGGAASARRAAIAGPCARC